MKFDNNLITAVQHQLREVDGQDISFEDRRVNVKIHLSDTADFEALRQWVAQKGGRIIQQGGDVLYASLPPDDVFALRRNVHVNRVSLPEKRNESINTRKIVQKVAVAVVVVVGVILILQMGADKETIVSSDHAPEISENQAGETGKNTAPEVQQLELAPPESYTEEGQRQSVVRQETIYSGDDYVDSLLLQGKAEFKKGHFNDAAAAFSKASRLQPERAETWFALGMALTRLGRKTEALEMLDKSVVLDPSKLDHLKEAAKVNMELGREDQAKKYITEILSKNPDDPKATEMLKMIEKR